MSNPATKASPREVREWAITNGIAVAVRGRIAREVKAAFTAATGRETA